MTPQTEHGSVYAMEPGTRQLRAGRPVTHHHDQPPRAHERDRPADPPRAGRRVDALPRRRCQRVAVLTGAGDAFWPAGTQGGVPPARAPAPDEAKERGAHVRGERPGVLGPSRWTDRTDRRSPRSTASRMRAAWSGPSGRTWRSPTSMRRFGVTCRRWNIGLADGGTQRLPRIVGYRRAMEMIITGRVIDSDEALRIGLVDGWCRRDLRQRAMELAHRVAELPSRLSTPITKRSSAASAARSMKVCTSRPNASTGSSTRRSARGCGSSTNVTIPIVTGTYRLSRRTGAGALMPGSSRRSCTRPTARSRRSRSTAPSSSTRSCRRCPTRSRPRSSARSATTRSR